MTQEKLRVLFGRGTTPQLLAEIKEQTRYVQQARPGIVIELIDAIELDDGCSPYPVGVFAVDSQVKQTDFGIVASVALLLDLRFGRL